MRTLRLKIIDLYQFEGSMPDDRALDVTALTPFVLKQFAFLAQPLIITIEGDEVVLQFPEESTAAQSEAERLARKAAQRAAEGNFPKAIAIYQRVLALQPSFHDARRDLAMAYVEMGDVDHATNHLIEVLRLNPADTWSWVVLGNLYLSHKSDLETAEKFLRKALSLKPHDAWALNSLATLCHKRGNSAEAIALFAEAIAAHPDLPNPYYGQAAVLDSLRRPDQAALVLTRLFAMEKAPEVRAQGVYDNARLLYARVQDKLAKQQHSEAFKCLQTYKAELETLSGYPVKIQEEDFHDGLGARIEMAWKHHRNHHLLLTRRSYAPELLCHLEAHELTHLKIEAEARNLGRNQFFTTTPHTRETALRDVRDNPRKPARSAPPGDSSLKLHSSLISGLCGFLFNCPLDMLIERHLYHTHPVLRPAQFLSLRVLAVEALRVNTSTDILKVTPQKIYRAVLALNGAHCLCLDDLFAGASNFAAPYRKMDHFSMAQRLYQHWLVAQPSADSRQQTADSRQQTADSRQQTADSFANAYALVDEFADLLGLRDWYEWKPDPGHHDIAKAPHEGVSNAPLLNEKHSAAVWFLVNALQRYAKLSTEAVREITFEIGRLGERGLDYANPAAQYQLESLPGEHFSGLQLLCLMFAGFQRFAPEVDCGIDFHAPFLTALELFQQQHPNEDSSP